MKLREITEDQKKKYMNEITGIPGFYDDMIKTINSSLIKYGDIHYRMTKNELNVNYAREQKDALKIAMKNANISSLDLVVTKLKDIKERYIKDIAPVTAITDTLELSFIEKELKVMTDDELFSYYKENYLDTNICRLIQIEYKGRKKYKDGKPMAQLPEYGVEDAITKCVEQEIKMVVSLRQLVGNVCCFEEPAMDGSIKPVMIPWIRILEEVENRNSSTVTFVRIADLYKYNLSK